MNLFQQNYQLISQTMDVIINLIPLTENRQFCFKPILSQSSSKQIFVLSLTKTYIKLKQRHREKWMLHQSPTVPHWCSGWANEPQGLGLQRSFAAAATDGTGVNKYHIIWTRSHIFFHSLSGLVTCLFFPLHDEFVDWCLNVSSGVFNLWGTPPLGARVIFESSVTQITEWGNNTFTHSLQILD